MEKHKFRANAVPKVQVLAVAKHAVRSEESSSESEFETEFESESDYESEYESLSTSEFSIDLNEEATVTKLKSDRTVPEIISTRPSNGSFPRKDNSKSEVLTTSVASSQFNWTACRYPDGKGCWFKIRDVATQPDNRLGSLGKHVQSTSLDPHSISGYNQPIRLVQDSIQRNKQDHHYVMKVKRAYLRSRLSQEDLQINTVSEECRPTQIIALPRGNSDDSSVFSILSTPNTTSDKDSTYEPGSDVESIESLDIESNDGRSNDDVNCTQPKSLVFLHESGEFLDSSMIVEEPVGHNVDNYGTLSDSQDNSPLHGNNVIHNESMNFQERHKPPRTENKSVVIKSELDESVRDSGHIMDVCHVRVGEFDEHFPFSASSFANVKMEFHEDSVCNADSSEQAGRDESSLTFEKSGTSDIVIKSEPVDPVDVDEHDVPANENRIVVYESCLRELLKHCLQCGATVPNPLFNYHGATAVVSMICTQGHRNLWKSQPDDAF